MAIADQVKLAYVVETSYAAGMGGAFQELRYVSEDFGQDTSTKRSAEIRSDRQTENVIRTSIGATGTLNAELSLNTFNDFILSAVCDTAWSTALTETSSAIYFTAPSTINHQGSFAQTYVAGQWIKVSGAASNANNGYFKIASVASGALTLDQTTIVTAAATPSITLTQGAYVEDGVTSRSYNIERTYGDLSSELALYKGMGVDTWDVSVSAENEVTTSFGFIGASENSETSSSAGSFVAATTTKPLNAIDDVSQIQETSAYTDSSATEFSFSLANGLRSRMQIGSLGPVSLGEGKIAVSGSMTSYYATKTIMDKYLNFTSSSLAIVFDDGTNGLVVEFPQIQFTNGRRVAGGENTDIVAAMDFEAFRNTTEGVTIRVAKF